MLDVNELPDGVLTDIMENRSMNVDDISEQDLKMVGIYSFEEAMDYFLNWNGIQGFTTMITEAVDGIRAAVSVAEIRSAVSKDIDTAWGSIQLILAHHGCLNNATLLLIYSLTRGEANPLALLQIKEILGEG